MYILLCRRARVLMGGGRCQLCAWGSINKINIVTLSDIFRTIFHFLQTRPLQTNIFQPPTPPPILQVYLNSRFIYTPGLYVLQVCILQVYIYSRLIYSRFIYSGFIYSRFVYSPGSYTPGLYILQVYIYSRFIYSRFIYTPG